MLVLLVESDALVRMVTLDLLADAGFQTLAVAKIAEAVSALRSTESVRALIVGRSVERTNDGVVLARHVGRDWPAIRTIVTSGMGGDIASLLPASARLLRKPFDFADLLALIEEGAPTGQPASAAPLMPDGIPTPSPMDAVAAPTPEPDKS